MRKDLITGLIIWAIAAIAVFLISCGAPVTDKILAKDTPDPYHLIPFGCSYLGADIEQLQGCYIACPRSTLEKYDLRLFTINLECTHPAYSLLYCGVRQ
jgi:hypothetical protein